MPWIDPTAPVSGPTETLLSTAPVIKEKVPDPWDVHYENMTTFKQLSRGYERGERIVELGEVGTKFRAKVGEPVTQLTTLPPELAEMQERVNALGGDGPGFVGWLSIASQSVGLMKEQVKDALITTPQSLMFPIPGMGPLVNLAAKSLETHTGLSFIDSIELGVDPEIAKITSLGVGAINAALDMVGATGLGAPAAKAFKEMVKIGVKKAATDPRVIAAIAQGVKGFGIGVGAEVSTELTQEIVSIAAEELGKEMTSDEIANTTFAEVQERMVGVLIDTVKGAVVLATPGTGASLFMDIRRARKAKKNKEVMDTLQKAAAESPLPPEEVNTLLVKSLEEVGVKEVFIQGDKLVDLANGSPNPAEFYAAIGGSDGAFITQVEEAALLGGDIRLDHQRFANLQQSELWPKISPHIRMDRDDFSAEEQEEFEKSGLKEETAKLTDKPAGEFVGLEEGISEGLDQYGPPDELGVKHRSAAVRINGKTFIADEHQLAISQAVAEFGPEIEGLIDADPEKYLGWVRPTELPETTSFTQTLAESQFGLQALFRTAKDAGMTDLQYTKYLETLQRAANSRANARERAALAAKLKETQGIIGEMRAALQETAKESVAAQPLYSALQGIGRERLDRQQIVDLLGEEALEQLPKVDGRTIYTAKKEAGVDLETFSDLYGFDSPDVMLFAMMDNVPFEQAVAAEVDRLFKARHPDISEAQKEIEQDIEALHIDETSAVLGMELNALRTAIGQKKLKPRILKIAAGDRLKDFTLKEISPKNYWAAERRFAKLAAKLLRKGDREGAAKAKFQQLLNFQFAQQAYGIRNRTAKEYKYVKKFLKKPKEKAPLPIDFRNIIVNMLGVINLKKPVTLERMVQEVEVEEGISLFIDADIVKKDGRTHYLNMPLREWQDLHDAIKAVEKQGLDLNKMLRAEAKETRQEIANGVVASLVKNLKSRAGEIIENKREKAREAVRQFGLLHFNTDTLVREADGFASLGTVYNAIKRPYDRAISHGYAKDQVGYNARLKKESQRLIKIFEVYSKQELLDMKKRFTIPGVAIPMSHQRMLATLLNMGNIENRLALIESGQFTEAQLDAIAMFASEKDVRFVQSVWDYLDEFWPEIQDTIKRRQNLNGEKVQATPLETSHGTLRGGYYPLQYDSRESDVLSKQMSQDVLKIMKDQRFGQFVVGHTRNGHTKERRDSGKRHVKLDPFVLNSHVDQVVYDLEVGDAVIDIHKILYHKTVRSAFQDLNRMDMYEELDLWFANIVVGEMHSGSSVEKAFRHLRTGFVVSKMGFNIMTVMMQPLGLMQSMPLIGKTNVLYGMMQTLLHPSSFAYVKAQSPVMEQRQAFYNRDLTEAQTMLKDSFLKRITPGNTIDRISEWSFYGIIKVQSVVDTATWIAAKKQGMQLFDGDEIKANEHADRMVIRTQASGIFGDRTKLERGAVSRKVQQSEIVRTLVPLMSYFFAKTNVAYERIKTTNYRDPVQVADLVVDMSLLFLWEALIVAAIRGEWPDEEDDPGFTDYTMFAFKEVIKAAATGIMGLNWAISEAEGFRGGGIIPSVTGEAGRFMIQAQQGDIDKAFVKSGLRVGGTLARIPGTTQAIRTGETEFNRQQGEDVQIIEYILGPRWKD